MSINVLTFNIGSFISQKKAFGSESKFIEENCGIKDCYKNSLNFLKKKIKEENINILGIQEFRVLNKNEYDTIGEFIIKKKNKKLEESSKHLYKSKDNNYSYEVKELLGSHELIKDKKIEEIMPNKKVIMGIVEGESYYEALTICCDIKYTGKILKSRVFNIVNNDIRPCLIIETLNFLIINLHAPWEEALYKGEEPFDEKNEVQIEECGKNLLDKVKNKINEYNFSKKKDVIIIGDFNDTYGYYKFDKFLDKKLYMCEKKKYCCYSELGMDSDNKFKSYGDYIISTLNIQETKIEEYNKENPMSDHLPLWVKLNNLQMSKRATKKRRRTKRKRKQSQCSGLPIVECNTKQKCSVINGKTKKYCRLKPRKQTKKT